MNHFGRTSAVTGAGIFLEACAFFLAIVMASTAFHQTKAGLPFWMVFTTLSWAFLLSRFVQSLPLSSNLRGTAGLGASVLSLLILSHLRPGPGLLSLGQLIGGDARTVIVLALSLGFLALLWWRGVTMPHDEVSLDMARTSFRWGLIVLFVAVLADSIWSAYMVSGYLVVGFFAVGLAGLSLARFSWEAGGSQVMPASWWLPIGASVGTVILLGLLISGLGMGGLDDVTRAALEAAGIAALLVLEPVFLALGYVAGLLVALFGWVAGWFGRGDFTGLEQTQQQLGALHEQLENARGGGGPPAVLVVLLKGGALVAAAGAAGWLLYRIFRFRRLLRPAEEVEETSRSLFSWSRANRDLSTLLADWWNSLPTGGGGRAERASEPAGPRGFYHELLALAAKLGRPRLEWETPKEHQGGLRSLLPREPVGRMVDLFQLSHYGQAAIDGGSLAGCAWTGRRSNSSWWTRSGGGRARQTFPLGRHLLEALSRLDRSRVMRKKRRSSGQGEQKRCPWPWKLNRGNIPGCFDPLRAGAESYWSMN